jgi:hypothetical protein
MNLFTTDHPLTSQPSWFDVKAHPVLSAVCKIMVIAMALTPLILLGLYNYAISDIGAEPEPFPDPWLSLTIGSLVSFIIGLICASTIVAVYRWFTRPHGGGFDNG